MISYVPIGGLFAERFPIFVYHPHARSAWVLRLIIPSLLLVVKFCRWRQSGDQREGIIKCDD